MLVLSMNFVAGTLCGIQRGLPCHSCKGTRFSTLRRGRRKGVVVMLTVKARRSNSGGFVSMQKELQDTPFELVVWYIK